MELTEVELNGFARRQINALGVQTSLYSPLYSRPPVAEQPKSRHQGLPDSGVHEFGRLNVGR